MKIVITGNMGCGKSTVVRQLLTIATQYSLFDFDDVIKQMYDDPIVKQKLWDEFGTSTKALISDMVHAEPDRMHKLRDIFDTETIKQVHSAIEAHENLILDIPLYFEFKELNITPDIIVCVVANLDDQIERVKQRNGWTREKIVQVLGKQLPQEIKASYSDVIIANVGTQQELGEKVAQFVKDHL